MCKNPFLKKYNYEYVFSRKSYYFITHNSAKDALANGTKYSRINQGKICGIQPLKILKPYGPLKKTMSIQFF